MVDTMLKGPVVLDAPWRAGSEMAISQALVRWKEELENRGFEVHALPHKAHEPSVDMNEDIVHVSTKGEIALYEAVGLVVINPEETVLELDTSVLQHMSQAAILGVPIYMTAPYEEVGPAEGRPDAEIIYVGREIETVIDRLEGDN